MSSYLRNGLRLAGIAGVVAGAACADTSSIPTAVSSARSADSKVDATSYTVTDLGGFGAGATQALAIDKHGTIYGRFTRADGSPGSFSWTEHDGYSDLGYFEGGPFLILGTNDKRMLNGSVLSGTGVQRAAAFLKNDGFVYLDGTNPGSSLGNNEAGAIVGTRFGPGTSSAFVWTQETGAVPVPLSVPGRTILSSGGGDINEAGAVAGTVSSMPFGGAPNTRTNRAFVWDAVAGTTLIPALAGGPVNVGVTWISDEGLVIGASEMRLPVFGEVRAGPLASSPGDVPVHAFKWSATLGLVDLGTLGGKHSVAWQVDKDENVYGWASDAGDRKHAVKWLATGGVIDLGTLGGDALTGGLNKHEVVTGWSVTPTGQTHVVLFEPKK